MSLSIVPMGHTRSIRFLALLLAVPIPVLIHAQSGQFDPRRQMAVSLGASGPTA